MFASFLLWTTSVALLYYFSLYPKQPVSKKHTSLALQLTIVVDVLLFDFVQYSVEFSEQGVIHCGCLSKVCTC